MAISSDGLEKAELTMFYEALPGKNLSGMSYVRLLPYMKVRPFDSVNGHTGNDEYIMPAQERYEVQGNHQEPYRVVMIQTYSGAFPYEELNKAGVESVHEFHNI